MKIVIFSPLYFQQPLMMSKKKKLKEALKIAIERSFKSYDQIGKDLFVSEVKTKEKS
jgi:superoxide dismutase